MIVMLLLVKILQALAGIVSTLALVLAAAGQWLVLGTSAPLILATIAAASHYRHRPDLTISRSDAWQNGGYSETGSPHTNARSSE